MGTVKGRIIEIEEHSLFLLTAEGEFLECPIPPQDDLHIGDEITVPIIKKATGGIFRQLAPYAAAAALFVFLLVQSVLTMASPDFYLHLDINPSIELGISKNLRVVEATPLNEDGEKVLKEVNILDKSIQSAVKIIVRTADKLHYIAPDKENTVLISVVSEKEDNLQQENQLTEKVKEAAREQLKEGKSAAKIGVAIVDKKERKEALKKHSSINSLLRKETDNQNSIPKVYKTYKVIPRGDKKENSNLNKKNTKIQNKSSNQNKNFFQNPQIRSSNSFKQSKSQWQKYESKKKDFSGFENSRKNTKTVWPMETWDHKKETVNQGKKNTGYSSKNNRTKGKEENRKTGQQQIKKSQTGQSKSKNNSRNNWNNWNKGSFGGWKK